MKKLTIELAQAALIRAIRTMAQVALTMITVGATISEIDWANLASVVFVAGVYSILTSILTGLPETATDGTMLVDTSDPAKDIYRLELNQLENLGEKTFIRLKVDSNATLSSTNGTSK